MIKYDDIWDNECVAEYADTPLDVLEERERVLLGKEELTDNEVAELEKIQYVLELTV